MVPMPRVLLVEADHTFRLRLVGLLSERFDLVVAPPGEDPLRHARAERPDCALLSVGARSRPAAIRLARVLKTDVRTVPLVGVYARPGEYGPSAAAFASCGADGYVAGADADDVIRFLDALLRGERPLPVPWPANRQSVGVRLFHRIFG